MHDYGISIDKCMIISDSYDCTIQGTKNQAYCTIGEIASIYRKKHKKTACSALKIASGSQGKKTRKEPSTMPYKASV